MLTPGHHSAVDADALPPRRAGPTRSADLVDNRAGRPGLAGWMGRPQRRRSAWRGGTRHLIRRRVDRPAPPRRSSRATAGLWARLAAVPVPVPLRLQLPGRPGRALPRRLRPLRRGPPADRRLLDPLPQHPRLWPGRAGVLDDLKGRSTSSRTGTSTSSTASLGGEPRRNVERAHEILAAERGSRPEGFAGPRGALEPGARPGPGGDGLPLFVGFPPGLRRPAVLPVGGAIGSRACSRSPIHPICEGALLRGTVAGDGRAADVADHLIRVGPGEGRRGGAGVRLRPPGAPARPVTPGSSRALARGGRGGRVPLVWRDDLDGVRPLVALEGRRGGGRSMLARGEGRYEVQFDEWDASLPAGAGGGTAGEHVAVPARCTGPCLTP